MESYRVGFSKTVEKDFRKIPKHDTKRILAAIQELSQQPHSPDSKKLTGTGLFRIRVEVYRIVYEIRDDQLIVTVVKVSQRKDIYR